MTEISVVIPVFNGEAFLEECLSSVMSQSFRDFEAIVVNDGSSDSSLEIAKEFATRDLRFKLITTPNRGVSAARNAGVDVASGDFITFLDADDCLFPDALATLLGVARRHEADVVVSPVVKNEAFELPPAKPLRVEEYDYPQAMRQALYQRRQMNSPGGVLVRRGLLTGVQPVFREGIRYEDLDAFYRYFQGAETIAYLHQPVYFYRDNSESFTNRWSEGRLDVLDVTDRIVDFFREKYPDVVPAALDRRFSAHYNMLLLMYRNGVDNPEAEERCWKIIREGRRRALTDRNVRLKNKLGALLSFGGKRLIKLLS